LQAIYEALKQQEKQSQRQRVSFSPKRIPPPTAAKQVLTVQ
jgi:hypothetical protein